MVHCNNCTSDINAWATLLHEFAGILGVDTKKGKIYDLIYEMSQQGEKDCGGLVSYNYYSGEPVTGLSEGRPLFLRTPDSKLSFANFSRNLLYSAMASLKMGMDLLSEEKVELEELYGHGGYYIYPRVGQSITAAALGAPVSVMKTAGEGGPYGMALLALYSIKKNGGSLEAFLSETAFKGAECITVAPDKDEIDGFNAYLERYKAGLEAEKAACRVK